MNSNTAPPAGAPPRAPASQTTPGPRRPAAAPAPGATPRAGAADGAAGNERLTAMTGAVLLVLLAVEGFTLLGLHSMLTLHFFVGMLLIGPVLLKIGST